MKIWLLQFFYLYFIFKSQVLYSYVQLVNNTTGEKDDKAGLDVICI